MRHVPGVKQRTALGRSTGAWLAAAALALLATGCPRPYDPFRIPRAELRGRIHTIALAPLRVDPDVAEPAPVRAQIEGLATSRLSTGGFKIVEASEMERLWREAAADVGNVFDPLSGVPDKTRFDLVEEAVYRDLASRHRVDAVLYLSVYPVELYLTGTKVRFCGRQDSVYWPGGLGMMDDPTLVRAACLGATLYDMEEHVLYTIQSGIEAYETYVRQTRAARPRSERLQDGIRLQRAVDDAIGGLAGTTSK
jgi:hypothetical protein